MLVCRHAFNELAVPLIEALPSKEIHDEAEQDSTREYGQKSGISSKRQGVVLKSFFDECEPREYQKQSAVHCITRLEALRDTVSRANAGNPPCRKQQK